MDTTAIRERAREALARAPKLRQRIESVIRIFRKRPSEKWDAGLVASYLQCILDDIPEPDVTPCPSLDEEVARADVPALAAAVVALCDALESEERVAGALLGQDVQALSAAGRAETEAVRWRAIAGTLAGALRGAWCDVCDRRFHEEGHARDCKGAQALATFDASEAPLRGERTPRALSPAPTVTTDELVAMARAMFEHPEWVGCGLSWHELRPDVAEGWFAMARAAARGDLGYRGLPVEWWATLFGAAWESVADHRKNLDLFETNPEVR